MSKESYIRGFCKAADAAGVDPQALAKYAQQYKTDGWAPPVVSKLGTKGPIKYYPPTFTSPYDFARTYTEDEKGTRSFSEGNADHPSRLKAVDIPNLEYIANWIRAHQKSRTAAAKAKPGMAGKAYHSTMMSLTNNAQQAISPEKK